jgi:RNA recognition motif-containing protein
MGNKIYVGNLPFSFGEKELRETFEQYGEISEATVIVDKYSRRSKGFGFVTYSSDESAKKAVDEMNGKEVGGREIKVSEAKAREEGQ